MRRKKILAVIGARPQFIKHAPLEIAANAMFDFVTVHTGQHYDYKMSQIFFDELKMSKPQYNLNTGSGHHGDQTGRMMIELEPIVMSEKPDFVLVYGDTNSTLAGALVASKLEIPIAHVEAGLRSFNRSMPEEINRVLTDHLSSLLFVPTEDAVKNLADEGISNNVFLIGDVMCDMIRICREAGILNHSNSESTSYYFATIHRPYNTDNPERMLRILEAFEKLPAPVKFAVHPRTYKKIESSLELDQYRNIQFSEPLSYFDTIRAIHHAEAVITDSGGLQKEAYMLRKKCITIRKETEWVETLKNGWNSLVFEDLGELQEAVKVKTGAYIDGLYGEGRAANNIINIINEF